MSRRRKRKKWSQTGTGNEEYYLITANQRMAPSLVPDRYDRSRYTALPSYSIGSGTAALPLANCLVSGIRLPLGTLGAVTLGCFLGESLSFMLYLVTWYLVHLQSPDDDVLFEVQHTQLPVPPQKI